MCRRLQRWERRVQPEGGCFKSQAFVPSEVRARVRAGDRIEVRVRLKYLSFKREAFIFGAFFSHEHVNDAFFESRGGLFNP